MKFGLIVAARHTNHRFRPGTSPIPLIICYDRMINLAVTDLRWYRGGNVFSMPIPGRTGLVIDETLRTKMEFVLKCGVLKMQVNSYLLTY
jgi:hypothetical protein